MKNLLVLLLPFIVTGCCYSQLVSQLPDQIYFVNDSCTYALPDYTKIITPHDNCAVDYFYQQPDSGFELQEGVVTEVSIVTGDATGNERTIKFKVMLIDTIVPWFEVDTVLFKNLTDYQDETRTWHFTRFIHPNGDTTLTPEGFGLWGYYTRTEQYTFK